MAAAANIEMLTEEGAKIARQVAEVMAQYDSAPGFAGFALAVCAIGQAQITAHRISTRERTFIAKYLREAALMFDAPQGSKH